MSKSKIDFFPVNSMKLSCDSVSIWRLLLDGPNPSTMYLWDQMVTSLHGAVGATLITYLEPTVRECSLKVLYRIAMVTTKDHDADSQCRQMQTSSFNTITVWSFAVARPQFELQTYLQYLVISTNHSPRERRTKLGLCSSQDSFWIRSATLNSKHVLWVDKETAPPIHSLEFWKRCIWFACNSYNFLADSSGRSTNKEIYSTFGSAILVVITAD